MEFARIAIYDRFFVMQIAQTVTSTLLQIVVVDNVTFIIQHY